MLAIQYMLDMVNYMHSKRHRLCYYSTLVDNQRDMSLNLVCRLFCFG